MDAQPARAFADSIRLKYNIPELGYAVVSADSVYELELLGVSNIATRALATTTDRFRIGSNTKAITGYIAARLVKQGRLSWETKFFDLFPELKAGSRKEYQQLTLLDLLTFRTRLIRYTYTNAKPVKEQFTGDETMQRYQFAQWFFEQEPVKTKGAVNFSNLGYVAAGLMMERATGKTYQQLVNELGQQLGISFGFGRPYATDRLQTCGYDASLTPETSVDDHKLDWLLAAGNINCSLSGYAKFIQLQLKGLRNGDGALTMQDVNFLHYGLPRFSVGWFAGEDGNNGPYSWNIGNPGSFLSKVYVFKDIGKAFILFSNAQTDDADRGLDVLLAALKTRYSR